MRPTLTKLAVAWGEASEMLSASRSVLVVDDDAGIRKLFATILKGAEFDCDTVATGEEALEDLGPGDYDYLVVDKNLPDLTGLEVIRRARERDPDIEAVLVTAYPSLESILQAIDLQSVDYLTKPLESIDVLTTVLGRARRRRNRRLLARRMLDDLREAVASKADDTALAALRDASRRVEEFRDALRRKKRVVVHSNETTDVLEAVHRLEALGFSVWTVDGGGEALSICSRRHVSVLVVSDDFGDLAGAEVVRRVSEAEGRPELLFVTKQEGTAAALDAVERGAAGYLLKPLRDERALIHAARRAADNHHERLYHYRMIAELYSILSGLGGQPEQDATRSQLEAALAEFDVKTARHAIRTLDEEEFDSKTERDVMHSIDDEASD